MLTGVFLLIGALDILCVVLAIDVLDVGQGWPAYFNAAFGAGGLIGSVAAMALVGRRYLAPPIALGALICGVSFVVIALWPSTLVVVLLLAFCGIGRVFVDVACRTLLQRTTPAEVLGRVFGVLEGVMMAGLAVGALVVPPLVALGGSDAALIGAGLLLPVIALVLARPLDPRRPGRQGADRRDRATALDAPLRLAVATGGRGCRPRARRGAVAGRSSRHPHGRRGRPVLCDRRG